MPYGDGPPASASPRGRELIDAAERRYPGVVDTIDTTDAPHTYFVLKAIASRCAGSRILLLGVSSGAVAASAVLADVSAGRGPVPLNRLLAVAIVPDAEDQASSTASTSTTSPGPVPTHTASPPAGHDSTTPRTPAVLDLPGARRDTSSAAFPSSTELSTTTSPRTPGTAAALEGTKTDASWALGPGMEKFKSTPWNNQGATDPSAAPSPTVPGRQVVKFHMPGGGKRTEAEPDIPQFEEGETSFVGYSGFFDKGFPVDPSSWQLIMQFKQPGEGSPPLAVQVEGGQLRLDNNGTSPKEFCPVQAGQPFSFRLGITFGGTIDAWCNGKQTLTKYQTPSSNVKGSAYLKTGIYRDSSIGEDSTLFVNDLKVGKSLASVSGLAGAPDTSTAGRADSTTLCRISIRWAAARARV